MKKRKLKVAVTGGIGSGKTSVCDVFREANFPVLEADKIAKDILNHNESVKKQIVKEFGKKSYSENGLNVKFLASEVFTDSNKVKKINLIVHPPTIAKINDHMKELLQKYNLVFVEAALIFEAEMEKYFDYIILVSSDKKNQLERAVNRDKNSTENVEKRIQHQIPEETKRQYADFIIENNSTLTDLKLRTGFILSILEKL